MFGWFKRKPKKESRKLRQDLKSGSRHARAIGAINGRIGVALNRGSWKGGSKKEVMKEIRELMAEVHFMGAEDMAAALNHPGANGAQPSKKAITEWTNRKRQALEKVSLFTGAQG